MSEARHVVLGYDDLVETLRGVKAELGLSNDLVDELNKWARGRCDKYLGPTQSKLIGAEGLFELLAVFGLRLELIEDREMRNRLAERWEQRRTECVTRPRISKVLIDRARPIVFAETGRLGAAKVNAMRGPEHRKELARRAAQVRWEQHRQRKREARQAARGKSAKKPPAA